MALLEAVMIPFFRSYFCMTEQLPSQLCLDSIALPTFLFVADWHSFKNFFICSKMLSFAMVLFVPEVLPKWYGVLKL